MQLSDRSWWCDFFLAIKLKPRINRETCLFALSITLGSIIFLGCSTGQSTLQIHKGDHVILVGNTLAERMQYFGHFETLLHSRFPEHNLIVRNLGYSADEVIFRPRSLNFGSPEDHLKLNKADIVLAFFGFNESFSGPEGLKNFKLNLTEFIQKTKSSVYNGKSSARLVLVSPIAHENLKNPNYPDGTKNNINLELYTQIMEDLSYQHDVPFVNLFTSSLSIMQGNSSPLTFNGIHLSDYGYSIISKLLDKKLFGDHPNYHKATTELRNEINEKNLFFFHRYRAVNGFYIYGDRSQRNHGNPPFTDAYVLENERGKLDDMVAIRDQRIWKVAKGLPVSQVIDDTQTRPLYDVPTNFHKTTRILPPKEAIKHFKMAPGYEVNLFASEAEFPLLKNPVQLTFDSKGRLWVLTMPDYPMFQPPNQPNDRLLLLEDLDKDGRADKLQIFAEGLHVPTGFELGDGGVYVAQQPNLVFLKDTDGDDRADIKKIVLHGFDSADSHHSIGAFTWGPGGGLYMNEGTFHYTSIETYSGPVRNAHGGIYRFDPTKQSLETFVSYNFANPWGHVFDPWGQNFLADASSGNNYYATAFSGRSPSFSGQPDFGPFKFVYRKPLKPFLPKRVRPTSGCEIVSSRHFPPSAQGIFLLNNVIGFQGILQHKIEEDGSGFKGIEIEPLLFSSDTNFRPIDLQFGPDGALYVVDWFNPLIGHMQHNLRDPNRDKTHGRVWRITYPSRPLLTPPKIAGGDLETLLELLKSPESRTRYRVRLELRTHDREKFVEAAKLWINKLDSNHKNYEQHLLEILWTHQHHNAINLPLLQRVLSSPDYRARAAGTRVLSHWRNDIQDVLHLLRTQVNDEHPRVRLEAVRALSFLETPNAAEVALEILKHPLDYYLDYTLNETINTLKPYWKPLIHSGHVFLESNLIGKKYLLKRLEVEDLQEAAPTQQNLLALLERTGVAKTFREKALKRLAEINSTNQTVELLKAIHRADKSNTDNKQSLLKELGLILKSQPVQALNHALPEINFLIKSAENSLTRRIGWMARISAEQNVTTSWQEAFQLQNTLLDLIESIPMIPDPQIRSGLYSNVVQIIVDSTQSKKIRTAAIQCLPHILGREMDSIRLLTKFLGPIDFSTAAIRSIEQIPRKKLPLQDVLPLLEGLLSYLNSIPVDQRTSKEGIIASQLSNELIQSLPDSLSGEFKARLNNLQVTLIVIRPQPHRMQYDLKEFFVAAGRPVEIVFENIDIMPHNLIITSPGSLFEVAMAAEKMATNPNAFDLQFIPDSPNVLHASKMLQPQEIDKIRFTAPKILGDYPYVCTFPGHWRTMFGTMHVVASLDGTENALTKPEITPANIRKFVKNWRVEDMTGRLNRLDYDRDFTNGANLFQQLSCNKCHQMNGKGGSFGPDLTAIRDKLISREMDRTGLLREIIEPSRLMEEKYRTEVIKTIDGRFFTGFLAYEDDHIVRLITNVLESETVEEVVKQTIAERRQLEVSPMPEALVNTATSEDILDLLAYLASAGGLKPTLKPNPPSSR